MTIHSYGEDTLTNDGLMAQLYSPLPALSIASTPKEIKLNTQRKSPGL